MDFLFGILKIYMNQINKHKLDNDNWREHYKNYKMILQVFQKLFSK